jgi:hypothetical protein
MAAAASAIGDGELSAWLTEHVPAAIVAGQPLPERPERRSRGRLRLPWRR